MSALQSNVSEFFRTCSVWDVEWFITTSGDHFIGLAKSTLDDRVPKSEGLLINRDERTISFPAPGAGEVHAIRALAAFDTFVSCLLKSDIWDNGIQLTKQSRIRCRNAILVALGQIYKKLGKDGIPSIALARKHKSELLSLGTQKDRNLDHVFINLRSNLAVVYRRRPLVELDISPLKAPVTLVIPSAGRSSRFPGHKPKWLLTQPNGRLMLVDAIGGLDLTNVGRVVIGVLREHVNVHCGGQAEDILTAFGDGPKHLDNIEIALVVLEKETNDQVQTIEQILAAAEVTGPIFLKDCDNQFACPIQAVNGVATLEITKDILSISIPAGKSYVSLSPAGVITNIVEKVILGNTFCVGGYSFASAETFTTITKKCRENQRSTNSMDTELAVSDIIWMQMLTTSAVFVSIPVTGYEDWGTLSAWLDYTRTFKTLFCDIDGTLLKNSGQYFAPRWGTQPPLEDNVAHLRKLHEKGRTQIILTTTRPESFREKTKNQLADAGVPYDKLVMGLWHGQRVVINDYAKTNPFPSALAVNLKRNADDLREHLDYSH